MTLKRTVANLVLLLGTLLFSILALEAGLRLFSPQPMTKANIDLDLGWFHAPKTEFTYTRQEYSTTVRYNSFGLRDSEYPLQKPAGLFRIAVLGDSYMEGAQVALDSVFSKVLERILQDRGHNCETLNFGVTGYGTDQELVLLKKYVFHFDPDLVILSFSKNDVANNIVGGICSLTPKGELKIATVEAPLGSKIRAWLWGNSHLFVFLNVRLPRLATLGMHKKVIRKEYDLGISQRLRDILDSHQDLDGRLVPLYAKEEDPRLAPAKRLTEAILLEIYKQCREREVAFLLLINSGRFQLRPREWERRLSRVGLDLEPYDPDAVDNWLLEFASREGFAALSCIPRFRQLKAETGIKLHWDIDGHWNNNGHREAARLTAEALERFGLLPAETERAEM
ncbi:MAG: hypothetical protein AMJ41_02040 [candidate division Zixibacteria bacterium DG_27]|nr:MAG: hypothetical protein AMJ41_02040 [candidate division Zixibacteria bacterium DG_27]